MSAKIGMGRDTNRVPLWQVVPRAVPFSVGFAPSDICNFRCVYCNQSTPEGIKGGRILPWKDFLILREQLNELVEIGKQPIKNIRLIGNGEPLTNPRLPDMVKILKEDGLSERLEVTTNASLLTHAMADRLVDSGLTRLLVSVQGISQDKYQKICGVSLDFDKFLEQLQYFYQHKGDCQVYIKTVDVALSSLEEEQLFYKMFSPVCDSISVENIIRACADVDYNEFASKDIDITTRYGKSLQKKICCDTLFMYLNIHSTGNVDCCGCKYPPHFIGNIFEKPLKEIWNGKEHRELMAMHLKGKRWDVPDCATCDSIEHYNGFPEDNLDEHLPEVLAKLEKMK